MTDNGGDYTVHGILGLDQYDNPWLLDVWREQSSSDKWVESFCDLVLKWHPIGWAEETGQIKASVGPFLSRTQLERAAYVAREQFPTRGGDKGIRAQSMRGRVAVRKLRVPRIAPWKEAFISELMKFPAGVNDDQHDMLGLLGQLLDRMMTGRTPPPPEPEDDGEEGIVPPPITQARGRR